MTGYKPSLHEDVASNSGADSSLFDRQSKNLIYLLLFMFHGQ